ncbi:MAG: NUDIX hydrolase [Gammaproteobacteria bacterium]|nr:NUDIX hydrolase [Gammaproteobacteria bacterium]
MPSNNNRKQAVVAIIRKSGKFLLVKRSDYVESAKGYWCPVSGRIENGETQEQALRREVMEEVGLDVVAEEKVCEIPSHDNKFTLNFWTAKIISGEAKISSNEVGDIRWVTIEEMENLSPIFEEDLQIFKKQAN